MRLSSIEEKMIGRDTQYMATAQARRTKTKLGEVDEPKSPRGKSRYDDRINI
jgi:hypothetical protein